MFGKLRRRKKIRDRHKKTLEYLAKLHNKFDVQVETNKDINIETLTNMAKSVNCTASV